VKEKNDLMEKKPVGSSAAGIQEQMETCQVEMMSCSAILYVVFVCFVLLLLLGC